MAPAKADVSIPVDDNARRCLATNDDEGGTPA